MRLLTFGWILGVTTLCPAEFLQLDFRNFTYEWTDPGDRVPERWRWLPNDSRASVTLVDGRHAFANDAHPPFLQFNSVAFGELDGQPGEEAAVDLVYSTGGTANWHYLYVFRIAAGRPVLMARLESGSRARGGLKRVQISVGRLLLQFADPRKVEADCCSKGTVQARYRWDGARFR